MRINERDLGVDALEALELAGAFRSDPRVRHPGVSSHQFEFVRIEYLDTEGDEWKASYRVAA